MLKIYRGVVDVEMACRQIPWPAISASPQYHRYMLQGRCAEIVTLSFHVMRLRETGAQMFHGIACPGNNKFLLPRETFLSIFVVASKISFLPFTLIYDIATLLFDVIAHDVDVYVKCFT